MLKTIAKHIEAELNTAQNYCKEAMLMKSIYPTVSQLLIGLSADELNHAKKLMREGQRLVDDKTSKLYTGHDSDEKYIEKCKHIWEWEHQLATEKIAQIEHDIISCRGI